MTKTTKGIL